MATMTTTAEVTISAPVSKVFDTVAHIENFQQAVPHVVNIEYLSETKRGVGTRFAETRVFNGREARTELEITEYVVDDHVRIVSESGGALWDSVFTVRPSDDGGTHLKLVMESTPRTVRARLMNPLIRGFLKKALQSDMDAVKAYLEG